MSRVPPIALLVALLAGCGGPKVPPPMPSRSTIPLAIPKHEGGARVYQADEEIAPVVFPFEGATGSVRVTMEVETTGTNAGQGGATINDVLFRAEGSGRLSIAFKKPWPGHPEGRVTLRCSSGGEESEADFEPETWLGRPSAIVTLEFPQADPSVPIVEGREVVLARFVARNLPKDIRLTLKAMFSRDPVPPRVKAGPRPPR